MSWRKVKVSEFLTERTDRFKPDVANSLGLKRVGKIDFSGNIHLTDHKPTRTNMILVKKGDLLISGINAEKGAVSIYDFEVDAIATIHYSSYSYDKNKINIQYLTWFLKSREFKKLLKAQAGNGIKTEIKPKKFLKLVFDLPCLTGQIKIAKKLESVGAEINELRNISENNELLVRKLRQSILQDAIQGGLTKKWRKANADTEPASILFDKVKMEKTCLIEHKKIKKEKPLLPITKGETPYNIPDKWEWCRLGEICSNFDYGTSSKSLLLGKYPVLRMGNIQNGNIDWTKLKYTDSEDEFEQYKLSSGDLLFNRTNSREMVGKTAIYLGERNAIHAGYLVRVRLLKPLNPFFANTVLNSPMHRDWCNKTKRDALGQSNINATKLKSFVFPLPPIAEQEAIVLKVNHFMTLCDKLEAEIFQSKVQAKQLLQATLQKVFTPKGNRDDIIRELLPNIDRYAQVAMSTLKIENELKCNYGKVEKQKTGFLLQAVKKQPIPYTFEKQHFGTFSWELSNDLDTNPYLRKTKAGQGEVYEVKASKHQEVLGLLNAPKNASFVQALDELIQVYKMPLINAKTDQIELLNTVCKSILDTQSTELETIYGYMEFWTIKQERFNTKSAKFSRPETEKMLQLVLKLGWEKELINPN